jgi:hypothetical protein
MTYVHDSLPSSGLVAYYSTTRLFNTVYQNTTSKTIAVNASYKDFPATGSFAYVGTSSPPTNEVARTSNGGTGDTFNTMTFFVNPTYYYEVSNTTAATILNWVEWSLF